MFVQTAAKPPTVNQYINTRPLNASPLNAPACLPEAGLEDFAIELRAQVLEIAEDELFHNPRIATEVAEHRPRRLAFASDRLHGNRGKQGHDSH